MSARAGRHRRSRSAPGAVLHPARARLRRRARPARRSTTVLRAAEAVARGRRQPQGRPERQVRHARVRQPRHRAARLRARHDARVVRARGAQAARLDSLAQRHLGWTTLDLRGGARQGRRARSRSPGRRRRARPSTPREDADITLRCTTLLHRASRATRSSRFVYDDDRDAGAARCCSRIERNGVLIDRAKLAAQSHELGERDAGAGAAGLRGRRPAVQPRLAEADRRDPVRAAEAAGEEEDAVRRAVHRRGGAAEARRATIRCRS